MALLKSRFREDRDGRMEERRRRWDDWAVREPTRHNMFLNDWEDWPKDWPAPRDIVERFWRDTDRWFKDWPSDWPTMDREILPRFSSHLDRMDPGWRNSDFWKDIYPRWAEPIFKEGIDVKTNIVNDGKRFAVDIDAYQFKPEELQVKTLDDTLIIEGRHEDVKDRDNFTKMYFVRKYQLPNDVEPQSIASSIDGNGRLTVEAPKRYQAIEGRERTIPIESPSRFRSSSYSRDREREHDRYEAERDRYRDDRYREERRNGDRSSPVVPAVPANDFRRSEFERKASDQAGMRYEAKREEFRQESRNGFHAENGHRNGYPENGLRSTSRNRTDADREFDRIRSDAERTRAEMERERDGGYRSESRQSAHDYRDERRGSGSRPEYRVDTPASARNDAERQEREERESVRSVRVLRKTFN